MRVSERTVIIASWCILPYDQYTECTIRVHTYNVEERRMHQSRSESWV